MPGRQIPQPMTLTQKILAHHAVTLAATVGAGRRYAAHSGGLDHRQRTGVEWDGSDVYPAGAAEDRQPGALLPRARSHRRSGDAGQRSRARSSWPISRATFAQESGITHFYDANVTIMHTSSTAIWCSRARWSSARTRIPARMAAWARLPLAWAAPMSTAAMVLGETWIEVPEAISVEYEGEPPSASAARTSFCGRSARWGVTPWPWSAASSTAARRRSNFTTDMRFTICNMTAEFGGLNGIFEADELVADWLAHRRRGYNDSALYFRADDDAPYVARYPIQLDQLAPQVAKPFSPDNVYDVD